MSASRINWSELGPSEVMLALHHLQDQGLVPVSEFLDTHQWSGLQSQSGLLFAAAHENAQFRRVGLGHTPAVHIIRLSPAEQILPPNARRRPRWAVSRWVDAPSLLGDAVAIGEEIVIACCDAQQLDPLPWAKTGLSAWPDDSAMQHCHVASLRLDALIARCFMIGRAEAAVAIEQGFVFLNFKQVTKPSVRVTSGSQIVFRGKGRICMLTSEASARGGRWKLAFRSFPV